MSLATSMRIARRELRGGAKGFWVFLLCLTLGVGAIAAVGTVRSAIEAGLQREGATILGGNAQLSFSYRFASESERAWMESRAERVSEIVDFLSMAVAGEGAQAERGLTQIKGVDDAWPLLGVAEFVPPLPVAQVLGIQDGVAGAAMAPLLIERLGLSVGDRFRLGTQDFELRAAVLSEPDSASGGFGFGPRTLVLTEALEGSGLLGAGTLFETQYRLAVADGTDLAALRDEARAEFREAGMRWRDATRGAPGIEMFVDRIGSFLVLVGLAGLAVGGVGVSAAVRAYLESKIAVIATLRTLGAERRTIFMVYFLQIGVLTLLGVGLGMAFGALVPNLFAPLIASALPIPAAFGIYWGPLLEAGFYGVMVALLFTLWPLARIEQVRAATLFRQTGGMGRALPRLIYLVITAALLAVFVLVAARFSGMAQLAYASAFGIIVALGALVVAAWVLRHMARIGARSRLVRGNPALRWALAAVGGPREEASAVILSLGLGLAVLASVGQVDSNLRSAIQNDLPAQAPAFFFLDIQNNQLPEFMEILQANPGVTEIETAPMLRGIITRFNDRPAEELAGNHWVLRGDRGVTYSATPPPGTQLTAGEWWPEDYDGPPLVSFSAEAGEEIGLQLGDTITLNILGREITAEIASFQSVDFSGAGMGFVLSMNPSALAGVPHAHIATVYADPQSEVGILRDTASAFPNITVIAVRDAIDQAVAALTSIATATALAASATLLTGFVVLIGAAAAGERARVFEAAVLKTLGATRGRVLASFALRSAMLGAAAGLVAIAAGGVAGWAVMTGVMDLEYRFEPISALAIVAGGIVATLLAGLAFALRPLAARPAQVLRAQE